MQIGVPMEIKAQEYRVGLTPAAVGALVDAGHGCLVQAGAGIGSGFSDADYLAQGATLVEALDELYDRAELVVKVKEPQPEEWPLLRAGQRLFCYLHLAPDIALTDALLASGAHCFAYETIADAEGRLPLLKPMSEIAGRLSVQAGAHCLEKAQGGRGVLLGSVAGLAPAHVLIFGGGVVGSHAADVALGMGAQVTLVEPFAARREQLAQRWTTRFSVVESFDDDALSSVELVIGAALKPGARAPLVLRRTQLKYLPEGAVLVDVAVDQGGCFETSHATTHQAPTFVEEGIVHYCVANIPSAVSRTATLALSAATLPYVKHLAEITPNDIAAAATELCRGQMAAMEGLYSGLNVSAGSVCCRAVAEAQNRVI